MSGTTTERPYSADEATAPPADAPPRPAGVPSTAIWVDADGEWRVTQTDQEGRPHGAFRAWRADGSVRTACTFEHGKETGPLWKFHPDGSLFSLGCYADGTPRGVHRRYANDDPRAERLQSCCVPDGAWQLRHDYSITNAVDRGWFDRAGNRLLESGALYPERPQSVPGVAWFNEEVQAWETGLVWREQGFTGTRRRWSKSGALRLVENLREGKRHGVTQSFDEDGALLWEAQYREGKLHGSSCAVTLAAGHFADQRAHAQRGAFLDDQAVERWEVLDASGAVIQERELGPPLDAVALKASPVMANVSRPAEAWRELAGEMFSDRRVGEGLVAAARAAAAAGASRELADALAAWALPLGAEGARSEAAQALERGADDAVVLIDALRRGADPTTMLWMLAKALPDDDHAALDLVTAASLLSPQATEPLATRTLLNGALGQLAAARADVARLSTSSPEQAAFLDQYLRIYFPRFAFWPAEETFAGGGPDVPLAVARTADEVAEVIQRYATRLGRLREALRQRVDSVHASGGEVAFMIPDLGALLPRGPLSLSRWTFAMSAEEYGGTEGEEVQSNGEADGEAERESAELLVSPSLHDGESVGDEAPSSIEITVDELVGLDPSPTTILRILRRARADWSGLVWLCWAVGLNAPGLPSRIAPPAAFGQAAVMTMERVWRCRDKLRTSGLLALTKGIPGFDWEGTTIDLLPSALADVALEEYIEARAIFSWLCDPVNRSPWQEDLRAVDD